jgi:serine protease Do
MILSSNFNSTVFAADKIGAKQAPVELSDQVAQLNSAFENASNAVIPTVVSISVVIENNMSDDPMRNQFREFFKFFGHPMPENEDGVYESEASGSGVIISSDGYIVTNYHVVKDAKEITVTTNDKKEHTAELIGTDPLTDLAVLKIEGDNYQPVHFADIKDVKVGELVIAVGNPLGLNSTVTAGIVSAIGRGGLALLRERGPAAVENFIQTDAAINPGNSGGGLFNLKGSLIGINTAIATRTGTYIGYGFAIPVDLVKAVVLDLIEDGKIDRGFIGVTIRSIDEVMAKSLGLDKVEGVLVNDVMDDSGAKEAGIEPGDVIIAIDGEKVEESNELQNYVAKKRAGDKVKLTIIRDGKKISKVVTLKAREGDTFAENTGAKAGDNANDVVKKFEKLGFSVRALNEDEKDDLDVKYGVMVTEVKPNSPAWKRGLMPGGVIVKAGKTKVKSLKDLKKAFAEKKSGDAIMLQVQYKGQLSMIAVEIP